MELKEILKQAMQDKNIKTITELSRITGISYCHLCKILKQENANITQMTVNKLNNSLNLKLKDKDIETDNVIKKAMKLKGIKNIKELSILTGLSQNNLYRLTETSDDSPIKSKTANKLNKVLELELVGIGREDDHSIGYRLYKLRTDRDISAEKLSVLADTSIATISAIERNLNKPNSITIKKLAKAFDMNENELKKYLFKSEKVVNGE